jgi:hypothetical protein
VESDNQSAEREMDKRIYEAACFAFTAYINKELRPGSRLEDVRQADDIE